MILKHVVLQKTLLLTIKCNTICVRMQSMNDQCENI